MRVTWKARAEEHGGLTSPEELIAFCTRVLLLDGFCQHTCQE